MLLAGSLALAGMFGLSAPAQAERLPQDRLVSPNPVDWSPNVVDGTVYAIAQVGNKVIIGGTFTQLKDAGSSTVVNRRYLAAFNATTGKLDTGFQPNVDQPVRDILAAPDGDTVYIGGNFATVGGANSKGVARINVTNGARVTTFKPAALNGQVRDLELAGGRLYVGGTFTTVGGVSRTGLATLNPETGARDDFVNLNISGLHNGGTTKVWQFAISPDQRKLVVIGNFTQVGGRLRDQFAMLDLTGDKAEVADYYTKRFEAACSTSVETYLRDVEFAPGGGYFVIATTGAYRAGLLCDTLTRWETGATGTNIQPTWVNYTGGDTLTNVALTGEAIYVGGHNRWLNNPYCGDRPCQGAVARSGIAAVNPVNGLPYSWNPGRDRGHAVEDIVPTSDGLWIGSDTDRVAGELHQKIAKFPLTGKDIRQPTPATLPGDVYAAGGVQTVNPDDNVDKRSFDGTTAGAPAAVGNGGIDWSSVRGGFMLDGTLYYGMANGELYKRTYNGQTYGAATLVNTADQLARMTTWHSEVSSITGMFFANGRIYYTKAGNSNLYYRFFEPESGIVGAEAYTASGPVTGVSWSDVQGMFKAGNKIYYASRSNNGALRSVEFTDGKPVAGTATTVATGDWRARALFVFDGVPNSAPTASFTSSCQAVKCSFDATASKDSDGQISKYAWDFGDGGTGTGAAPDHAYEQPGTYTVKLTVTDNKGETGSTTKQIQVIDTSIGYRATAGYNGNSNAPKVTVPAGVQPGDQMLLILTANNTSATAVPPPGWTQVATAGNAAMNSKVWRRTATAADAGADVTVPLSATVKTDLRLLVYRNVDGADPIAQAVSRMDGQGTVHTTGTANVTGAGRWVVSYWSDKGTTTSWTAPSVVTRRAGSGGGTTASISTLVADSAGAVPTGSYGGLAATANVTANNGLMWTIVLNPAP
ncbi:PKD domain-containing protein [Thermomonospora amylolytica]|uniref:PKD domain-containing protein n=1 Tax=Thermomonospora amylolytica TaxID=1411117 RepID=UPI000E6CF480|nr:PKD domain-containing protein [Thermomonospora amylolytica]